MKTNPQIDKALERFTDMMIEKIETIQQDWKKPWFCNVSSSFPQNIDGRNYNGGNAMMLMMITEMEGYELPIFGTFERFTRYNKEEGKMRVSINKGAKSFPVFMYVFNVLHRNTKQHISYDEYRTLSDAEQANYNVYPSQVVYNVFNVAQTNLAEARPEVYEKLKTRCGVGEEKEQGANNLGTIIDKMIDDNLYYCPIRQCAGDQAYYSISKDEIVVPKREQFVDAESFVSNVMHECAHATGAEGRLNRLKPTSFGSKAYATEELVAEMTAAVICSQYGIVKHVKDDSAAYLRSWLESLKEDTKYIKTIMDDVRKASAYIEKRIEAIREGNQVTFDKHHEGIK